MKRPFDSEVEITSEYDFARYFNAVIYGENPVLKKHKITAAFSVKPFIDWEMYAKVIVWYGRKDNSCTYIKQAQEYQQ